MFENDIWKLRRQLVRINKLDDSIGEHLDSIKALDREETAKVERELEQQRQRELAPAPPARDQLGRFEPAPAPAPAPASPHALFKARTLGALRGTAAPPAPATSPNPVFAEIKQRTLAGLRGGR